MIKLPVKILKYILFFFMINISVFASSNDEVRISVNGQLIKSNQPPARFENGIILAPIGIINEIAKKVGAEGSWNDITKISNVRYKNIVVTVAVDNLFMIVDNRNTGTKEEDKLDDEAIPRIYNGIAFLPVDLIYMRLGLNVQWDGTDRILHIAADAGPPPPPPELKTWALGASLGTSFAAPLFIGTVYGTYAPFKGSFFKNTFLELGMDAGLGIYRPDVQYFSMYPFVNYALFTPFPRPVGGILYGWYAGLGLGGMFANYIYDVAGQIWDTTVAMNFVAGINIFDMIDVSYTLRTNFKSADNKLSVGYVYRF